MFDKKVSFRRRNRLIRSVTKFFKSRRGEHLANRVFQSSPRSKKILTSRQKTIIVSLVVVVCAIFGFTSLSGFFDVTKVTVLRSSFDLPLEDIELAVRKIVLGENIFSVDASELTKTVQTMSVDVSRVRIKRKYPREIQVEVFKYPIVAELRFGTQQVFINENGHRVFGEIPEHDTLQLTLGEEIDLDDSQSQIIYSGHLTFIRDAVFYFEALTDLKILNTKYFPISREVHIKTEKNFDIWLDLATDYRTQLNKLADVKEMLNLQEGKYEYIDLRIGNKIFYKDRD